MAVVKCKVCGADYKVIPARLSVTKFCSYKCAGIWRSKNSIGKANPNYRGGRHKQCAYCGADFWVIPATEHKKFCSRPCADKGGFRYTGKDHANYREDARRKNRGGHHHKWVTSVLSRDRATCQHCGATEIELHAHHIKSYRDHPELRFEVSNGITLCYKCHWQLHAALNENSVNSGKPLTGKAEGNPEPSFGRKPVEGVTTRGRAYRRWFGECSYCKSPLSKPWSDVKGKKHLFCSYTCSAKWKWANGIYRQRQ